MFSKNSRYYKVPNVAVSEARRQVLIAKDLRPLPQVTGTFQHLVQSGDRLDHLSYKYYSQPLQWWHICDANPRFLSPLALLDQEVVVTTRFPVTVTDDEVFPSETLLRELYGVLGVEDVQVFDKVEIVPKEQKIGNETILVFEDRHSWDVIVTYNELNVAPETLIQKIEAAHLAVERPVEIRQLGQEIVIPPKVIG
jgi:hypothetical protein